MTHSANITFDSASKKYVADYNGAILAKSRSKDYVIQSITTGLSAKARAMGVTAVVDKTKQQQQIFNASVSPEAPIFGINERFEFLEILAAMVINNNAPSLVVTGPGGYGKTYTVIAKIKEAGLTFTTDLEDVPDDDDDDENASLTNKADAHIVKGFSTARGLYRTLYENNGKLIVFDDCDSVFRDINAVNILKGALDSTEERWISWNAEARIGDQNPLPRKFLFTGRIIFISNMNQSQISGPIKSRSLRVSLDMTTEEKIQRMQKIVESGTFMESLDMSIKIDALKFLKAHMHEATELSMRTLIHVSRIRNQNDANWQKLALYAITA